MDINKVYARLQLKRDTLANWSSIPDFVPMDGEPIIVDNHLKLGDGTTKLADLPDVGQQFEVALESNLPLVAGEAASGNSSKASRGDHVHPKQPSADRWTNPRTISVVGAATGSVALDGSSDVALSLANLQAGNLVGEVRKENLPSSALTKMVVVENAAKRYELTVDKVQNGDTVFQTDNGVMYLVVDEGKLTMEEGYQAYSAATSATIEWSNIANIPSFFLPSSHSSAGKTFGLATEANYGHTKLGPANTSAVIDDSEGVAAAFSHYHPEYLTLANVSDSMNKATYDTNNNGVVDKAEKLAQQITLSLNGDVAGSVSTDFSNNTVLETVVADDSHNHSFSTIAGLQTALDAKTNDSSLAAVAKSGSYTSLVGVPTEFNPSNHAVDASIYGLGTRNLYGHLKLGESITPLDQGTLSSVAAPSYHIHSNYLTNAAIGDMMEKTVYDSNGNGVVDKAEKLASAITISVVGDAIGNVVTDFSANPSLNVTVVNDSHNHSFATVDGLQAALDSKTTDSSLATIAKTGNYADLANVPLRFDPTNHSSNDNKYGLATDLLYGHVRVGEETTPLSNSGFIAIAAPSYHTHPNYLTSTNIASMMEKTTYDTNNNGVVDHSEVADKLTNARTINNVPFDGTASIVVEDSTKIPLTMKGNANGVAELDGSGKVLSSQLPSYVDDVLECPNLGSFPAVGESGKIYIDTTTEKTYRWSGTAYVNIGSSLALGETSSTAYRGDRGKVAYDHSQQEHQPPTNSLVEESVVDDNDRVAAYDTSAAGNRKFSLLSIKQFFKTFYDTLYAKIVHTHNKSDVVGLVDDLAAKANVSSLANVATSGSYTSLVDVPSTFVPSSHASTGSSFGLGSANEYGHLKLGSTNVPDNDPSVSGVAAPFYHLHTGMNAGGADKLTTARSIGLGGAATGAASFDGTSDITIPVVLSKATSAAYGAIKANASTIVDTQEVHIDSEGFLFTTPAAGESSVLWSNGEVVNNISYDLNATLLNGSNSAFYLNRANHTGTQPISSVANLQANLDNKVNVVTGKQLSTNDFTTLLKSNYDSTFAALPDQMNKSVYDTNGDGIVDKANIASYVESTATITQSQVVGLVNLLNNVPSVQVNGILNASGWVGSAAPYTQTIAVAGLGANDNGYINFSNGATAAQRNAAGAAALSVIAQTSNSLTVAADWAKPTIDIPITTTILY